MNDRAWHYTIGVGMAGIAGAGVLRRSTTDIGATELPAVWFTQAAFEPTIAELRYSSRDDSRWFSPRGPREYRLAGNGLYRLGLPLERLVPYRRATSLLKMPYTRRKKLEAIARKLGSELHLWHAALDDVSLFDPELSFELFDGTLWCQADRSTARDLVVAQQMEILPQLKTLLHERGVID